MRFVIVLLVIGLLALNVLARGIKSKPQVNQHQPQENQYINVKDSRNLGNGLPDKEGQYELKYGLNKDFLPRLIDDLP